MDLTPGRAKKFTAEAEAEAEAESREPRAES
jgi:hypothetical protein